MPIFDIPVREFPRHVLEPLVEQYVHRLINECNLQHVIKDNIHINYGFSTITKTKDRHKNININTSRVDVEVEVNLNPDNLKWDITNFKWNPGYGFRKNHLMLDRPLFADPEADVYLYLHEVPCNVTMNITFTLMSRTNAYMLNSAHYELHGGENTWYAGDYMFDIPVNHEILRRLLGIFKMRRFDTEKINFSQYLQVGSQGMIGTRINRTATEKEYIIRQMKCQILEDVEINGDKPQENKNNNGTISYSIPFVYTIQFSRPSFYSLIYPISIMNQLIPIQHLPNQSQSVRDNIRNIDWVKSHLEKVTYEYWENVYKGYETLFVSPFYEDWRVPNNPDLFNVTQRPFWIITLLLDEDENGTIAPETWTSLIGEIVSNYYLDPTVKDIIGIQACESYEPDCLFNVSIYKDDTPYYWKDFDSIGWDVDTISPILKATDRAERYHIVLSEMIDLSFLNPKWYFLLEMYKDFFKDRNGNDPDHITGADGQGGIDSGYHQSTRVLYGNIIPLKAKTE